MKTGGDKKLREYAREKNYHETGEVKDKREYVLKIQQQESFKFETTEIFKSGFDKKSLFYFYVAVFKYFQARHSSFFH